MLDAETERISLATVDKSRKEVELCPTGLCHWSVMLSGLQVGYVEHAWGLVKQAVCGPTEGGLPGSYRLGS